MCREFLKFWSWSQPGYSSVRRADWRNTPWSPSLGKYASPTISSAVTLLLSEKLSALRCSDVHLFGGARRCCQIVCEEFDDGGPRSMWANVKTYLATKVLSFTRMKREKSFDVCELKFYRDLRWLKPELASWLPQCPQMFTWWLDYTIPYWV